jgi:hypothetical protein
VCRGFKFGWEPKPEELTVAGYPIRDIRSGSVQIGCKTITRADVEMILKLMEQAAQK